MIDDLPSPFVVEWIPRVAAAIDRTWAEPDKVPPPPRALDLAMGRGRHARLLARAGFLTFGVDVRLDAVRDASARARYRRPDRPWMVRRSDRGAIAFRDVRCRSRHALPATRSVSIDSRGREVAWWCRRVRNLHRESAAARMRADIARSPAGAGRARPPLRGLRGVVLRRSRGTRGRRPDRRAGGHSAS